MMAGYSQEVIQKVVGQDDPSIFKRYAHLSPDIKKEVVREVGNMFESLLLSTKSINNWKSFLSELNRQDGFVKIRILNLFDKEAKRELSKNNADSEIARESKEIIIKALNRIITEEDGKLYDKDAFSNFGWDEEGKHFLQKGYDKLSRGEKSRFNRLILENVFQNEIAQGQKLF